MARTAGTSSTWGWQPPAAGHVLLLLRHAKSDWKAGETDHERPLNRRGRAEAGAVGRTLAEQRVLLDVVACSTARRTRQTWEGAVATGAATASISYLSQIYLADVSNLVEVVRALPESAGTAMLIGHSPGLGGLVDHLGRRSAESDAWAELDQGYRTAGLAVLTLSGPWAEAGGGTARLVAFEVPRRIPLSER